ncbi:MAG: hypothetical protein KC503_29405 [Myxococcales bacterium]|nr:hypothetical protein [Myxococcales bacterium]
MSEPRAPSVLSVLWPKVIRSKRRSTAQRLTRLTFVIVALLIAYGIHAASVWFLRVCYNVEVVGPLLLRRLLDVMLLVMLSVLLISNLVTALSSFFLADDLELLVAAPIPPRTLFAARFVEQVLHSSWMVLAFGVPVLLAFARVAGTPWTYGALVVAVPPLLMVPAAVGSLVTVLLVTSLPAARVRDLVVAFVFVAFIVLYIAVRLVEPERFINPEGFASMVTFLASFSAPSGPFLPSHWATSAISSTFRDSAEPAGWLMLATLWTGAGATFAIASLCFRRMFRAAFSRSQEGRKVARLSRLWSRLKGEPLPEEGAEIRAPGRRGARVDWMRVFGRVLPAGAAREFLVKDLKLLLRDASQWSQLVLLLALVFVYLYNFRYFRSMTESGLVGPLALFLIGMGLSGFVTAAVSVRFAFPLVSLEGRMMWFLRAAPVEPRQILRAKVISTVPPLIVVAEVMSIASSLILGAKTPLVVLGAVVAGLTAASVGALATGLGAVLPDYRAESAAKIAASFGGLVCMSLSILASFALVGAAAYPALVLFYGRTPNVMGLVISGVAGLVVTAICVLVPLKLGSRAIARFEP